MPIGIGFSVLLVILAGMLEIGGGYRVWLWLRESRGWRIAAAGGARLFAFAVVSTVQRRTSAGAMPRTAAPSSPSRSCGGWWIDATRPDRPERAGALLRILGVGVILYWPRP